jgi:hypothetical protein
LSIARGDAEGGVANLQRCLAVLHRMRYELLTTQFNTTLIQGLAIIGRLAEATALAEETITLIEARGDLWYMPEVLCVKANLLRLISEPNGGDAETCYMQSLELSRRHSARAWELRTATDSASLWIGQGQSERAHALLQPVFDQLTDGSDTADLRAAGHLLASRGRA